jgi:hypothetical protein
MSVICTLANINAIKDLRAFLFSLELFNRAPPTVYLLCDTAVKEALPPYKGVLKTQTTLDKYGAYNRLQMTNLQGKIYRTLWEDFMMEKATVLEWAFTEATSVYFADSDIFFMGALPEIPAGKSLAVCPHRIRPLDEAMYGRYNAGFLWTSDKEIPMKWRAAAHKSRFFDQAALEDLVTTDTYEFPTQTNYGWWRMFQAIEPPPVLKKNWTIFRSPDTAGIRISGEPLLSIHTHWVEKVGATAEFNKWVFSMLEKLGSHQNARALTKFLSKEFQNLKNP